MRLRTARMRLMEILVDDPTRCWFGYDLLRATKVSPGNLYAALAILESSGVIESGWSDGPEPRRRWYRAV